MTFKATIIVTWDEFNDEVIKFLKSLPPPNVTNNKVQTLQKRNKKQNE